LRVNAARPDQLTEAELAAKAHYNTDDLQVYSQLLLQLQPGWRM